MPALFSPRASALYRGGLLAAGVALTVGLAAPCVYIRTPYAQRQADPIEQPVAFDHRHHVRDDGIDCVYCHSTVETSADAGLPPTSRCMGCHAQIWTDSPELARVRDSWRTGEPIRWRRVDALPEFVYFHHGVHIQAGVACAKCHGDIANEPRVRLQQTMAMEFCVDCHRERSGSRAIGKLTTCSACHR